MSLERALKEFSQAFAASDRNFGTVQVRNPIEVDGPLSLGQTLNEYYARLVLKERPQIGGAMQLGLFALGEELVDAQSGWRWIRNKAGEQVENPNWKSVWVVIADRNGDAIFVDTDSPHGSTYGSIQQRNFLISADLASFLLSLAECMRIEREQFNDDVLDDEFNVVTPFLEEARSIAERHLGAEGRRGFMRFFFE